jgi:hypothetical protein
MLIKNMFDNRDSKWEKLLKESKAGPMKVEELRKETERKLQQEQEERNKAERDEQAYLEGQRGGSKYGRSGTYQGGKGQYNGKD